MHRSKTRFFNPFFEINSLDDTPSMFRRKIVFNKLIKCLNKVLIINGSILILVEVFRKQFLHFILTKKLLNVV